MRLFTWGEYDKKRPVGGKIFCKHCYSSTTASVIWRVKEFSLFAIPISSSEELIGNECDSCNQPLKDEDLSYLPNTAESKWKCENCGRSWPLTHVRCTICKTRPGQKVNPDSST
ncbi:MAG TPA: hypothetical protein DD473_02370 [Planctomycetaceae bacterium]|nr:hypothetical protein [Planctomycetaceae bacterium]